MLIASSITSKLSSLNPELGLSDEMSARGSKEWAAGQKERAEFMNASPDEIGMSLLRMGLPIQSTRFTFLSIRVFDNSTVPQSFTRPAPNAKSGL